MENHIWEQPINEDIKRIQVHSKAYGVQDLNSRPFASETKALPLRQHRSYKLLENLHTYTHIHKRSYNSTHNINLFNPRLSLVVLCSTWSENIQRNITKIVMIYIYIYIYVFTHFSPTLFTLFIFLRQGGWITTPIVFFLSCGHFLPFLPFTKPLDVCWGKIK